MKCVGDGIVGFEILPVEDAEDEATVERERERDE